MAVCSLLVFAVAHLLLPATAGPVGLGAVAVLMGVGDGLSNGLVMTLGADAAPDRGRTEFLGAWRLCHAAGMLVGPLALGLVAAVAPPAVAVAAMGLPAAAGAAAMARWVPPRRDPRVGARHSG